MNVKWYYRQSEVPDSVYQHLVQDRNNENGETAFPFAAHTRLIFCAPHTCLGPAGPGAAKQLPVNCFSE